MGNVTGTTAAKYIQEAWTRDVQKPFYKTLQFAKLVTQRGELVSGGGNKINVPFLSSYDARDKSATVAVTYDANTEDEVEISINKHKYLAFLIEDFAKVQSNYNLQELYRGAAAEAVARAIDTDLGSLHASAGTNVSAGAALEDSEIITVVGALDAADVPRSERFGVIHTEAHQDLLAVDKFITYDNTGQTGVHVTDGMVSNVYGMPLFLSNNVVEVAGSPNLLHNIFAHKKAMSLALQLKPTFKAEDSVDHIGMKFVLHTIYGVAVERATAMVDVELNS